MSETVFINYRRDDSAAESMLIAKAIRAVVGNNNVFMDSSSIEYGALWPEHIKSALLGSRYVLAVIGPEWLRAGSDEWGQRRIDKTTDWVRLELETALNDGNKTVIPVLIRGGRIPPANVLPEKLAPLSIRQAIELRRDYWAHDIKLLTAQINKTSAKVKDYQEASSPYPTNVPVGPDAIDEAKLDSILLDELKAWSKVVSPLPEDTQQVRIELFREYKFRSFQNAIGFMNQVAPGCDMANHHPRWENLWKTVRIYLTTWDIGHRISDRDVQLARYFDRAYAEYPERAQSKKAN